MEYNGEKRDLPYEQKLVAHQQKDITVKNVKISFPKLHPCSNTLKVTVSMPHNNLLPPSGLPRNYTVPHISSSGKNALFPIQSLNLLFFSFSLSC